MSPPMSDLVLLKIFYAEQSFSCKYDRILINPFSKPEWYFSLNPNGKVPLLRYRNLCIPESDAAMQYVDNFNRKPETSLLNACGEGAFRDALPLAAEVSFFLLIYLIIP